MKRIKQLFCIIIMMFVIMFGSGVEAKHVPESDIVTVRKGDTLYSLSQKYHMSVEEIQQLNRLKNSTIYPGQRLILEQDKMYKVITGSFTVKEHASRQVTFLKQKGITATLSKAVIKGKKHYRVQAEVFTDLKNAKKQLKAVKKQGFADSYLLSVMPLNINGIAAGDSYASIEKHFGKASNIISQNNHRLLYYEGDGAGIHTMVNPADGKIKSLTLYPEFLNKRHFPSVPFTKKSVMDVFGYPNTVKQVSCYESASCEEVEYMFNGQLLTVRIDRDGSTVQFMEIRGLD